MFGFFDVAFSLYVRNSFNQAIGAAAREVYVDPDRTANSENKGGCVRADCTKYQQSYFGRTDVATATVGIALDLQNHSRVFMDLFNYKSPILNRLTVTLEGRKPGAGSRLSKLNSIRFGHGPPHYECAQTKPPGMPTISFPAFRIGGRKRCFRRNHQ